MVRIEHTFHNKLGFTPAPASRAMSPFPMKILFRHEAGYFH
jgi:hypothetical protein